MYVTLCKSLEKAMQNISHLAPINILSNCLCDPTPPYSTQTLLQRFTTGISFSNPRICPDSYSCSGNHSTKTLESPLRDSNCMLGANVNEHPQIVNVTLE